MFNTVIPFLNKKAKNNEPQSWKITLLLALLLVLVALPFAVLFWIAVRTNLNEWPHLLKYVLPHSALQTLILMGLVAVGTILLGAGTAWLTTLCDFPGKSFFSWALVLPLAVPTYIAAYTHVEFFGYSGDVQSFIRVIGGYTTSRDYWFPDIRSLGGAGLIFSFVLYPYVYLTCRLIFTMQGASALDVARSLGASPSRQFWKIGLPMARPALAAGVALALMETLNDIGAVEILGVKTLPYAVFETWLNRDNLGGAVQLALLTLLIVALLIWIERKARSKRDYASATRDKPPSLLRLNPWKQLLSVLACSLPLVAGLIIPIFILGRYTVRRIDGLFDPSVYAAAANSFLVAFLSAGLATLIAYGVLQYGRISKRPEISTIGRIASLGYAIPGTVLALGLFISLAGLDNWIDAMMREWFGISTGLLFSGSIMIIVYACTLRFLAIAYGTIETGFSKISPHIDMAARALGRTSFQTALEVHRPIMMKALGASFLLVFVDTMKELSATLLVRPFDFETLATLVYDRASQAALEDAAFAALLIILIGLIPIIFLSRLNMQRD